MRPFYFDWDILFFNFGRFWDIEFPDEKKFKIKL